MSVVNLQHRFSSLCGYQFALVAIQYKLPVLVLVRLSKADSASLETPKKIFPQIFR
jgi:hypothetical protein